MGKVKISELPSTTVVGDNDLIQIVQQNTNKKISLSALQEGIVTPESVGNAGAELTENKSSEISLEPSTTKYPTERAVAVYVENNVPVQGSIIGGADGFHAEIIDKNLIIPQATEAKYGVVSKEFVRTVDNLVKASKGIVYTDETDETSAYIKNIASGTQKYGLLNAISGKTILWNQSANPATFVARTASGVTTTLSADGKSIIANGTANTAGAIALTVNVTNFMTNHKYMFEFVNAKPEIQYYTFGWTYYLPKGSHNFIQSSSAATIGGKPLYMAFDAGTVFDNFIITPQIFDLTQMFGAGNEPTTVEEFKAMFPNDYYEYDSGSLLSGKCEKVVSRKTDTTVISEYIIPEEVQNLEGYGQSYDNTYNVVDFDTKKFIAYGRYIDDVWTPYDTPQETDISAYIHENSIEVEAGGTLEFHQQNETKLKIPSKQTYMVKVGDAL